MSIEDNDIYTFIGIVAKGEVPYTSSQEFDIILGSHIAVLMENLKAAYPTLEFNIRQA